MTAEQPAPRTAAGLVRWIRHQLIGKGRADVLAVLNEAEAAAGQPPPDEAVRDRIAHAVGKALYGWGDDEPNTATGFMVRHDVKAVTDAVMAIVQESESASPPPTLRVSGTAAPPDDWSEIQHPGYGDGAVPERVSEDKESRPVPPMEAGAAILPSTVSDQHSAPERVGLRPPAVSGLDVERLADSIYAVADGEQYELQYSRECFRLAKDAAAEYARLAQPAARSGSVHALGHSAEASDKDE